MKNLYKKFGLPMKRRKATERHWSTFWTKDDEQTNENSQIVVCFRTHTQIKYGHGYIIGEQTKRQIRDGYTQFFGSRWGGRMNNPNWVHQFIMGFLPQPPDPYGGERIPQWHLIEQWMHPEQWLRPEPGPVNEWQIRAQRIAAEVAHLSLTELRSRNIRPLFGPQVRFMPSALDIVNRRNPIMLD